ANGLEEGVGGGFDDQGVEAGVGGGEGCLVAAFGGAAGGVESGGEGGQARVVGAFGGQSRGEDFEVLADVEQVADVVGGEGGDDGALAGYHHHQAVALQAL